MQVIILTSVLCFLLGLSSAAAFNYIGENMPNHYGKMKKGTDKKPMAKKSVAKKPVAKKPVKKTTKKK